MSTVEHKQAITSLIFQLADDDFLYAFRASEWLGLAPHIEEDVASSSIAQDTMGHAAMYYRLLEELGEGDADALAHLRSSDERRNSILTERVNGKGYYMETPEYDWAFQVVRSYFYMQAKKVKVDSASESSFQPLAEVATKVRMELYYHRLHWETWFKQLLSSTDVAKQKMNDAIELVMADFGDMFSLGELKEEIESAQLIATEDELIDKWLLSIKPIFEALDLEVPSIPSDVQLNGRNGEHTEDLEEALGTLSEVYSTDPAASW